MVLVLPAPGCQLRVGRITPQHKQAAGPHWDQLQQLAADSWRQAGHLGWRLVTHHLVSQPLVCPMLSRYTVNWLTAYSQ